MNLVNNYNFEEDDFAHLQTSADILQNNAIKSK